MKLKPSSHSKDKTIIVMIANFSKMLAMGWRASLGFPGGTMVKNLPASAGDAGLIPESGRSAEGGNSNLLQYSCLENPMDGGAWWATVHGVAESQTRLSS